MSIRDEVWKTGEKKPVRRSKLGGVGPGPKLICLILINALALNLAGCGRSRRQTLIIAHEGGLVGLDPHRQDEAVTVSILANIYQGLVAYDADLRLVPKLATGYSNPNDLTWVFHLREGVLFHDGRAMTADDVVYSLNRARRDTGSILKSMLSEIDRVTAKDRMTVEVVTRRPHPSIIGLLAQVAVIPRGSDPKTSPIGTGPYRFGRTLPLGGLRLERYNRYWGPRPGFDAVEFRNIPDEVQRSDALISGDIDFDASVSEGQRRRIALEKNVELRIWPDASVGVLGFDLKNRAGTNPLRDRRIRRAISLAIDRKRLSVQAYGGFARPAYQMIPATAFGYDPDLPIIERDTAQARLLLRQAGIRDSLRLVLEMSAAAWPVGRELKQQLAEVGVSLQVDTVPWERLYQDIAAGRSGFFMMGFGYGYGDASEVLNELHTYQPQGLGSNNHTGYSHPKLDTILELADQEFDQVRRRELLRRASAIVMEDLPYIPLYTREYCYGLRRGLAWTPRSDGLVLAEEFRWSGK